MIETSASLPTRTDPNRQIAVQLVAAWNDHDPVRVSAFYAADYEGEDVGAPGRQTGPEEIRKVVQYYLRAFPDLHIRLDDLVVEGDKAVMVWTLSGTQRGMFMRIPATGRPVAVRGTTLIEFQDGLIKRALRLWDVAGLLRAIGLLPEL